MPVSASDFAFMAAFPNPDPADWLAAVEKVLKGADFEKKLVATTADGIRIEPLYPATAPSLRPLRGEPGRWTVTARMDHPEPEQARALALADLEGGAGGLVIAFAGAPAARGHGLLAEDFADLDTALDGVMLDLVAVRLDPAPQANANALLLAELVERRRLDPATLAIDFGLDPLGVLAATGHLAGSWPQAAAQLAGTIGSLRGRGFRGPFVTVDTRPAHEAGASEASELAVALATAVAYLRALEAEGFPLAEARDALSFTLVADTDAFLTIAKLRAARLLWDRVQRACGLDAAPMRLHAETAWRSLTRRDPHVNMLRATIATFAAGIGGADSVTALPFTAALGLPDAFARRVARNTQLVLLEEANLWRVADPAAGAGGFEALTQALCEQAWAAFQRIEAVQLNGEQGIIAALTSGSLQAEIAPQRAARAKSVATRREPITGTSEYPNLSEVPAAVLDVARHPRVRSVSQDGLSLEPLPSLRLAEPYETLRDRADAHAAATGVRPAVFLATLGPVADFSGRAGFARNLFEAGGLAADVGGGLAMEGATDLAALVSAFSASGTRLACLCGSDAAYLAEAPAAARALGGAGAVVWLTGRPGELEAPLRDAGVKSFVAAGCDAVTTLVAAQAIVLPALPT